MKDIVAEAKEEKAEGEIPGDRGKAEEKKAAGGAIGRKRGGRVPGKKGGMRPDKRSRGGSSDLNPLTSAGNMSTPSYQKQSPYSNGGGTGPDNKGLSGRS